MDGAACVQLCSDPPIFKYKLTALTFRICLVLHISGLHHSIIIFRSLFSLFNKLLERMKKIKEFFIDCNNDIVITGQFVYI